MKRAGVLRILAWSLLVTGMVLAYTATRRTAGLRDRLETLRGDIERSQQLVSEKRAREAQKAVFDGMPMREPISLRESLAAAFPGKRVEMRSKDSRPLMNGWHFHSVEISWDAVPLRDWTRWLAEVRGNGQRPPWLLEECRIRAVGSGEAQITAVLSAVQK